MTSFERMSDSGSIHVHDRRRFDVSVSRVRVPAEVSGRVEEIGRVVEQLNELWARAEQEAEDLRRDAEQRGYEAGRQQALEEMAESLAAAHERAREFVAHSETRVVNIAIGAVRKILSEVADPGAVAELATDAVRSAHVDPGTRVRVHPDAAERVRARLESWAQEHGGRVVPNVSADEDLGPHDVVVESDSGTVKAGLKERSEAVEGVMRKTAASIDTGGTE